MDLGAKMASALVAHAIGDYLFQSDWMALEKTKRSFPALCHVLVYGLPFLLITHNLIAISVIIGTHFAIDRWRLARYVVFAKNFMAPKSYWLSWETCKDTGYDPKRPEFIRVWLLIFADNAMHCAINLAALYFTE